MQRKNFKIEAAVHCLPAERERKRNGDFVDPVKTECGGKGVVQFPAFSGFQKKGLFRSRTDAESILPAAGKKIQYVDLQSFPVGDSAGQNFHRKSFGARDADVAECAGEFFHVAFFPADENGKVGEGQLHAASRLAGFADIAHQIDVLQIRILHGQFHPEPLLQSAVETLFKIPVYGDGTAFRIFKQIGARSGKETDVLPEVRIAQQIGQIGGHRHPCKRLFRVQKRPDPWTGEFHPVAVFVCNQPVTQNHRGADLFPPAEIVGGNMETVTVLGRRILPGRDPQPLPDDDRNPVGAFAEVDGNILVAEFGERIKKRFEIVFGIGLFRECPVGVDVQDPEGGLRLQFPAGSDNADGNLPSVGN